MKEPVVLRIYRGERLIAVKQFLSPQIVIGRQSDAGLSLDDEAVSPLHAVIEQREDGYYVSDLGSEGGILIEGTKVLEAKVEEGESIEIGPYSVRFYVGVPKPPVPPDYKKDHDRPEREDREIKETRVEEIELSESDELPVLPVLPDLTNPSFDDLDEGTNPGVFVDHSESTTPNRNLSEFESETTDSGVHIQSRGVEETMSAQKSEPISSGTVAPVSNYGNVDEIIYPYSRGSVLEVVIAWQERILRTYHFSNKHQIFMSNSETADIYVPLMGAPLNHKLVSFSDECVVHVAKSMNGELYYDNQMESLESLSAKSALVKAGPGGQELKLDQGQMVKLDLMGDKVFAYIRFVEDTPAAVKIPLFDFTTSEIVGIFMSFASVAVIALYMLFYVPGTLDDTKDLLDERLKKAVITFSPPPRMKIPKIVEAVPKVKRIVKVAETKSVKKVKAQLKAGSKKPNVAAKKPGKPKAAAPSRVKTNNKAGSSRPGGSIKTGKKASNMETKKKDLTKTGLLSVLSGGGKSSVLDKAASGVGTTIGLADSKTGFQGQASDHKGTGLGTKLQTAGKGGKGSSLAGVGDLKTSGRGGGDGSYGTSGLGGKGTTTILGVDGVGADFSSNIDKDAIRRLIRKNKRALAGCYDRALTQNKNLNGKVVLSWKIINGGKMISPKVKSTTLNNAQVERCIISRLMVLTFPDPGPDEIAEVAAYPFVFNRIK